MKAIIKKDGTIIGTKKLTQSQEYALISFKATLQIDQNDHTSHVEWQLFFNGDHKRASLLVIAKPISGTENSLLRFHTEMDDCWMVKIGKRGSITALMAPKAYHQFQGRKAFGIQFKRNA